MKRLTFILLLILLCPALLPAEVNVKDLGAKGDGVTDDTAAFIEAVRTAGGNGETVRVPFGQYVISSSVELDSVTLAGSADAAWPADEKVLPVILPRSLKESPFVLKRAAAVTGICISYEQNYDKPVKYPVAIDIAGTGCWIRNVKIHGAFDGIRALGEAKPGNPGRLNIENVFMVNIVGTGVYLNGMRDVGLLENVEVWSPNVMMDRDKPVGFHIKGNDGLKLSNCFAFAEKIGFFFEHSDRPGFQKGAMWGTMTDCMADFCGEGIVVSGFDSGREKPEDKDYHCTLTVNGGTYWTHGNTVRIEGCCNCFVMSGCDLRANGGSNVVIHGGKSVSISGCRMEKGMKEHVWPIAVIDGGDNVMLKDNIMLGTHDGLIIGKGFKKLMVTGNIITCGGTAVKDSSPASKYKVIKDNL
ncbi:MAG: right-handed parallel beta-helix repeat-containing protein [Abditibacteriota bacterium]|nr:right-handed parallel beta-helix repeat-containing protein [Abditibacteriota bacterium]